jgi:hypothetical protein
METTELVFVFIQEEVNFMSHNEILLIDYVNI